MIFRILIFIFIDLIKLIKSITIIKVDQVKIIGSKNISLVIINYNPDHDIIKKIIVL
jgi:hypothetical protein